MSSSADQPAPDVGRDPSVATRVEQLYASYAPFVRSVCRSLLRDRLEAEDAVQQTFLSAQRALVNGSSPRDEAAWLATIARHESLARVRDRMREPLPIEIEEHESVGPDAHAAAMRSREVGELRNALAQLPLQQREAILLRELRGLSYEEVAATLSITTSAVRALLFRARQGLQTRLRESLVSLSPAWLQALRELAMRIGSGGDAAPTAAKVAALGAGAALFAGGALAPTMIGLGHAPNSAQRAPRSAARHIVRAAQPEASVPIWRATAGVNQLQGNWRTSDGSHTYKASAVRASSDGAEREGSTVTNTQDDGSDGGAVSRATSSSTSDASKRKDGGSDDSRLLTARPGTTTTSTTTTGTTTPSTTTTGTTTTGTTTTGTTTTGTTTTGTTTTYSVTTNA